MPAWKTGLIKTLQDKANYLIMTENAVVIYDKFPKAHDHYLVLPREDIPTIFDFKPKHLLLLKEMKALALHILNFKRHKLENFKIGFHADASMLRAHLHIVSTDFVSARLKSKKHWNSFNTRLFRPLEHVYDELKEKGVVTPLEKKEILALLASCLKCNQCSFATNDVPTLKKHLLEHWECRREKYN